MNGFVTTKFLTKENFKPYGWIITKPTRSSNVTREYLDYWNGLYDIEFDDQATIGYLEIRRQAFKINTLERHLKGVEIFIPVEGVGVMPFAPANNPDDLHAAPDMTKLETFLLAGSQGFVIEKGVWHFPPFPLTERMGFILVVRKETADDLEMREVDARYIQF